MLVVCFISIGVLRSFLLLVLTTSHAFLLLKVVNFGSAPNKKVSTMREYSESYMSPMLFASII